MHQFGHNDQKVPADTVFTANMKALAQAVIAAGGIPILVTSLSRRKHSPSTGLISPDLEGVVADTLSVASTLGDAYIDLNKTSMAYLNAVGAVSGAKYNRIPTDYTHLNPAAGIVFGNMVAELILKSAVGAAAKSYISPNATIVNDIAAGVFVI
jgi:lysophospholipase L1-like esterase